MWIMNIYAKFNIFLTEVDINDIFDKILYNFYIFLPYTNNDSKYLIQ